MIFLFNFFICEFIDDQQAFRHVFNEIENISATFIAFKTSKSSGLKTPQLASLNCFIASNKNYDLHKPITFMTWIIQLLCDGTSSNKVILLSHRSLFSIRLTFLSLMIFDGVSSIFMTSSDLSASRYVWKIIKSASSVAFADRIEIKCSRLINHFVSFYFPIFTIIFVQQNMFFIFLKTLLFSFFIRLRIFFFCFSYKFLHFTLFIVTLMRMRQFQVKQIKGDVFFFIALPTLTFLSFVTSGESRSIACSKVY